ncbi:ABC transporter ATP-binding protein [Candidatus Acetothermia bacterium]|nr:ABC transporter ATP-binding protein [Candidatus Acetothermia bacterium]MBI3643301.1 ABC transporter ATP-binding protein [Candidatus Acetothermia bacterium]
MDDFFWEEEKLGKAFDAGLMGRLLQYIRPYKWLFVITVVLSALITVVELALPYLTAVMIDNYLKASIPKDEAVQGITQLALFFMILLVFRLLFSFVQVYVLQYTGQKIMYDMRTEIFARLMRLPAKFFDRNPVGRLVTRATNDVGAINEMYSAVLVNLFKDVFLIAGVLIVMFLINWRLALFVLILFPLLFWITFEFRRRVRDAYREVRRKLAKLNAYLAENISGMRITHLFVQEKPSFYRFSEINREEYEANMRQINIFAVFQPLIHQMSAIATAVILWYGGLNILSGIFTLGMLVQFLNYVDMLFQPIRDIAEKYNILQGAMASSERIFMLLDESEERYDGKTLQTGLGRIEFRNVWFSYQAEQKKDSDWVLRGVSFLAEPGERVAIVGPTGSGKTTIISLLLRLYEIQKGQILFDGVDIKEMDLQSLRSKMAVVLQDVFLFSGDIMGNIRLQADSISSEKAMSAARFVQADPFIQELPNEYSTEVKERGATLSVGQRQLLAFARAIAFDPKVLVLDEATANIDSKTESLIQESIERILKGRTSIVIAHRLSTIRDSNQIIVLQKGRIIEQGNHEELFARRGLYHALYTLQFGETGISTRDQAERAPVEVGED